MGNASVRAGLKDICVIGADVVGAYAQSRREHEGGELDEKRISECYKIAAAALASGGNASGNGDVSGHGTPSKKEKTTTAKLKAQQESHLEYWQGRNRKLMESDIDVTDFEAMMEDCEADPNTMQANALTVIWRDKEGVYFAGDRMCSKNHAFWHQGGTTTGVSFQEPLLTFNPFREAGSRTKANVKRLDWVLLEMDEPVCPELIKAEPKTEEWMDECLAQQTIFWADIIQRRKLPVGALIYSGGKSIHVLVRVEGTMDELEKATPRLKELCWELHLDPADIGGERVCRAPLAERYFMKLDGKMLPFDASQQPDVYYVRRQSVMYLDGDVPPVTLSELQRLMAELVAEFVPQDENPYKKAVAAKDTLRFTLRNVEACLDYKGRGVRYDAIRRDYCCWGFEQGNNWESAIIQLQDDWMEDLGVKVTKTDAADKLAFLANRNTFNCITDWLDGLDEWDSMDRVSQVCDILGLASGDTLQRTL